jgi:hypothetical protein
MHESDVDDATIAEGGKQRHVTDALLVTRLIKGGGESSIHAW